MLTRLQDDANCQAHVSGINHTKKCLLECLSSFISWLQHGPQKPAYLTVTVEKSVLPLPAIPGSSEPQVVSRRLQRDANIAEGTPGTFLRGGISANITDGLRQGRVLSPLLFNVFFAVRARSSSC